MLANPKTTAAGYLLIVAAVATAGSHFLTGGLTSADLSAVLAALAGIGLVMSKDGGH